MPNSSKWQDRGIIPEEGGSYADPHNTTSRMAKQRRPLDTQRSVTPAKDFQRRPHADREQEPCILCVLLGALGKDNNVTSRGQDSFANLHGFAARLYSSLTKTRAIKRQHQEIARDLVSRIERGRMLDIGTGPGKLLFEIHQINPGIELFGLDISESMVQLAKKNLVGISVNVR